ncbi:hypothetical protein CsSME_00011162 [Camellia sinensis var. sinensis]
MVRPTTLMTRAFLHGALSFANSSGGIERRGQTEVDGATAKRSGHAACGGLIWVAQGTWISGFKHKLGISFILVAEWWGIWKGLQHAWTQGHCQIILEFDSAKAIQAFKKVKLTQPQFNLRQEIWELLERDWEWDIQQIWREFNGCADLLAKEALGMNVLNEVLVDEPPALVVALEFDLQGTGSSRLVRV